ncbi:futalosine hydrolase [Streptomyces coeruleorubidus]|uniref:futalosine hydrolase n=1 Tax=Streptomyces coeruleorubidus TaxID=116188 RepID=UPI00237F65EB|nr:futalosine hydrolase [Streptomyces coeruleorubidus]WDV52558.1 futalosine hydrolase [Streptomyces coeruleorubidus]
MELQAGEGRVIAAAGLGRVLVATAVAVERDAVATALGALSLESDDEALGVAGRAHPPPSSRLRSSRGDPHRPSGTTAHGGGGIDLLAVGVGPAVAAASTASALTAAALQGEPYDLVVSAGIGGGFQPEARVGSLVVADEIVVADLGAETEDGFVSVTELGFGTVRHHPPEDLVRLVGDAVGARAGAVLTVSTVTGTAERAAELRERHPTALAEAMEGFGVAEAAAAHGVPVLEVRAISNPVGPRDRAAWRIPDALAALTEGFGKLVPVLESWNRHDQ